MMLGVQSEGAATQSSGAKNTGCVIAMHPIRRSIDIGVDVPEYRPRLPTSSCTSAVPFAAPKTSHACHNGSTAERANSPKPPIALYGALSLKKNTSPSSIAANRSGLARQKLTSSISGRARKNWYQP